MDLVSPAFLFLIFHRALHLTLILADDGLPVITVENTTTSFRVKCEGSNLHSLFYIQCSTMEECDRQVSCIDHHPDCPRTSYSMMTALNMDTGSACEEQESGSSSDSGSAGQCLMVTPRYSHYHVYFGYYEETIGGVAECTTSNLKRSLKYLVYKSWAKKAVTTSSPDSDLVLLSMWKPTFKLNNYGQVEREKIDLGQGGVVTLYTDQELWVDCEFEGFFFGYGYTLSSTRSVSPIILKRRDGSRIMLKPRHYGSFERLEGGQGTRLRIPRDLVSISCSAPMKSTRNKAEGWGNRNVTITVNITVIDPPAKLSVPDLANSGQRIPVEGKMGCNFTTSSGDPQTEIGEFRAIIQELNGGLRNNLLTNLFQFLQFKEKAGENYTCRPLESSGQSQMAARAPFHFHMNFVPRPPSINKSLEDQTIGRNIVSNTTGILQVDITNDYEPILSCGYSGEPKPHVIWLQEGKEIFMAVGEANANLDKSHFDNGDDAGDGLSMSRGSMSSEEYSILNLRESALHFNWSVKYETNFTCIAQNYLGNDSLVFVVVNTPWLHTWAEMRQARKKSMIKTEFEKFREALANGSIDLTSGRSSSSLMTLLVLVFLMNLAIFSIFVLFLWRHRNELEDSHWLSNLRGMSMDRLEKIRRGFASPPKSSAHLQLENDDEIGII